ncbi:MAG: SPFH/Band 7/PHB domain protein [SAR324 cluster bacterium]|nr:SPFH/Band 7/PHB domain protein [SAR324 cluster bacterium]
MDKFLTLLTLGIYQFIFVEQGTNVILMRFGKYRKSIEPGLHGFFYLWGIAGYIGRFEITEDKKKVTKKEMDMREQVCDYKKETVISSDNVSYRVDAVVYYQIIDPGKAIFSISDYPVALEKLVQSLLRAGLGKYHLEEAYTNRSQLSESLTEEADRATDDWGMKVIRLEIKEFEFGDFAEDLLKQKKQEIEKRQQIILAEGEREAQIKEAEGKKQYEILLAEGKKIAAYEEAEAIKIKAEAEAEAQKKMFDAERYGYEIIAEVLKSNPEVQYYLKLHNAGVVTKNLSEGQATKLFLPNQIDQLVGSFSVLSDVIKGSQEP